MAATKTRALHAVPDEPAVTILHTAKPRGRQAQLTAEHETARLAMTAPEVVEEQAAAINTALRRLVTHTVDRPTTLAKLAEAMFILGYVNGASDQGQTGHLALIDGAMAEIHVLETAERRDARLAEAAIKAKGGDPA